MEVTTAIIDNASYRVFMPYHSQDMNFHFVDASGNDYLVDLGDIMDALDVEGAGVEDAIHYASLLGREFYWKVIKAREPSNGSF